MVEPKIKDKLGRVWSFINYNQIRHNSFIHLQW